MKWFTHNQKEFIWFYLPLSLRICPKNYFGWKLDSYVSSIQTEKCYILNEPQHAKNQQNGMCTQQRLRSAWASAWRKLGSLAAHWAYSEDWSDLADAQADLSLCWAHSHFVCFVMRRLKCTFYVFQESYKTGRISTTCCHEVCLGYWGCYQWYWQGGHCQ